MPVTSDPGDYWGQAVTLYTGYNVPSRKKLFDTLKSSEGVPLMRLGFEVLASTELTVDNFTALVGWHTQHGEDYDLAFVEAGGNGAHDGGTLYQATIVFIGIPTTDGTGRLLEAGELWSAGKFTGVLGNEWDLSLLQQYQSGAKAAINALRADHTTRGFEFSGLSVQDTEAVDADSFGRTAQAYDRAMKFFEDHAATLKQWETSLGEENAAWRGQAAGLFWQLVHQLNKNYDSYVDQLTAESTTTAAMLNGHVPKSKLSQALATAQTALMTEAKALSDAWDTWATNGRHDPHRILMEVLQEVSVWVLNNQIRHTRVTSNGAAKDYNTDAGFVQHHPTYGNLRDMASWVKIGDEAVTRWNKHVEDVLVAAAQVSLTTLKTAWSDVSDAFSEIRTKDTSSLTESYEDDRRQIAEDEANRQREEYNNALNNLGNNLNSLGDGLGDGLNDLGENLGNGLNDLGDGLGENFNSLGDGLGDSLTDLGDGLGDSFSSLGDGLGDNLSNLGNGLGDGLGDGLTDTGVGLGAGLGGLLNGSDDGNDKTKGSTLTNPDGSTTTLNPDGTLTTRYPDGTTQLLDPETGIVKTTSPDGTVTTGDLTAPGGYVNPDGSTTTLNPDGTLTTTFPDGTTTTIDPETGALTTRDPDGTVTTGNIGSGLGDSLSDLDLANPSLTPTTSGSSLDLDGLTSNLASSSGLGDGLTLNGGTSSLLDSGGYGDSDYDDASSAELLSGGAVRAPGSTDLSAGTSGTSGESGSAAGGSGSPLFPGMGGMGGMGSGAGGGNGNNGERVRNVLTDAGPAAAGRGRPRPRRTADEDEDAVVTRGRTATTGAAGLVPAGAGGAGQNGRSTESGDRARVSWTEEDEDVWGTDEGGAPAVIGR
ncbi:AAWKG family protein [Streptomyces sp. NPDC050535]|uniref:AAWKG family protein n=1 Tax=Streptomyces sp. NPDC050535 TaxID=3365626 RepID=UPI0037B90357